MIRVAYVIPGLHYGGMERILHDLVTTLSGRDFELHVVVVHGFGRFADGLDALASLHQVPPQAIRSLIRPTGLLTLFSSIKPDIVHSHTGIWFKASRAARLARVPAVVHTEHGRRVPDLWSDRLIDNLASRQTDLIIAVSDALADVLRSRVVSDPRRVLTIPNGVNIERLRPAPDSGALRRALGIPEDTPVIGSVGRLEPVKNYPMAIRALADLGTGSGFPAPVLALVGDGSERASLEALAVSLGVADRVRWLGWRDDVEKLYGAFDIFTLTSHSEGMSVSLLEAMSCGLCPVVTDVGGNRSVLGQHLTVNLVAQGDHRALAERWRALLAAPAERHALARLARQRVESEFSTQAMMRAHARLYQRLHNSAAT